MTAQQYLLSQAEHCRRVAQGASDPFVADELRRLATDFEQRAQIGDILAAERTQAAERSATAH